MKPGDELEIELQEADVQRVGDPSRAIRILALDEEIAALERINPKAWLYAAMFILLMLVLGAVIFVASGSGTGFFRVIKFIWPLLLAIAAPAGLYGLSLARNWRRRLRLERQLDELVGGREAGEQLGVNRGGKWP
jgi:hypothetical protein